MTRLIFFLFPALAIAGPHPGEQAFTINCAACHQVDTTTVGPSLVRIANVYPREKQKEFIKWTVAPGKKNPTMVQMPSMAHVAKEQLEEIHDYVLEISRGKYEKKSKGRFPHVPEPKRDLPYIRHAFLPDSSPASLSIIYPGNLTACWDTEACRLRYLWRNGKTRLFKFRDVYELESPPIHQETSEDFWSFAKGRKARYLGYRLLNRQPEFHYKYGEIEVRELMIWDPKEETLTRRFQISNPPELVTVGLKTEGNFTISSNQGILKDNSLTLTSVEAQSFTLTFSKP